MLYLGQIIHYYEIIWSEALILARYRAMSKFIKYFKKESQEYCIAQLVFVCKTLEMSA